jgi:hypothetical protein
MTDPQATRIACYLPHAMHLTWQVLLGVVGLEYL